MKIKLPITEKFLWDFYNFLEKVADIHRTISPRGWQEVGNPLLIKFRRNYEKKQTRRSFAKMIAHLKRYGYLKEKSLESQKAFLITPKGHQKILKIKLKTIDKKRRPDRKWQMAIYDIPESKKDIRDEFRNKLKILGHRELQKSIWICPYDVLEETEKIIKDYFLESYVKLFLIEEVDVD
ncbi:MAG: hypothetical protein COV69_03095 [Parcubacteria group bacterium CG11_big_fil_rev_8_21_14_0_20_39_14]|nr:MAG: hypothetical protein COV69_03095 [Parcubacteria group bacterium CG11_big_fil_rev_8_21_14_0_20_39_14]PIS35619.1 MAG: hypothetical protein COT36_01420 [Parcubacteria group bacterium CG08_land_8_20_14_0_20_38_56]